MSIGVWMLAALAFAVTLGIIRMCNRASARVRCRSCGHDFSDWFVWPPGGRYCYLCWGPEKWDQGTPPRKLFALGEAPEVKKP